MNLSLSNNNNSTSLCETTKCPTSNTSSQSSMSSQACSAQYRFIYELPYNVRKNLTDLLDADGSWRQLGGEYMNLSDTQLTCKHIVAHCTALHLFRSI